MDGTVAEPLDREGASVAGKPLALAILFFVLLAALPLTEWAFRMRRIALAEEAWRRLDPLPGWLLTAEQAGHAVRIATWSDLIVGLVVAATTALVVARCLWLQAVAEEHDPKRRVWYSSPRPPWFGIGISVLLVVLALTGLLYTFRLFSQGFPWLGGPDRADDLGLAQALALLGSNAYSRITWLYVFVAMGVACVAYARVDALAWSQARTCGPVDSPDARPK